MAEDGNTEWVWDAIVDGEVDLAKSGASCFDFKSTHRMHGTPLTAFLGPYLTMTAGFRGNMRWAKTVATDLTRWLMENGAETSTVLPNTVRTFQLTAMGFDKGKGKSKDKGKDKGGGIIESIMAGKPACTAIMHLRSVAFRACPPAPWMVELLDHLLQEIAQHSQAKDVCTRVPIPAPVLDLWTKIFEDATEDGDVAIVNYEAEEVRAHSMVLKAASPVLKAMLCSRLQEGCPDEFGLHTIRVEESAEVISACIELLYTGGLPCKPTYSSDGTAEDTVELPVSTVLKIFTLCHRWQLLPHASLLEAHLATKVNEINLEELLEGASLHKAHALRNACFDVARSLPSIKDKFSRGELSPAVMAELRSIFGGTFIEESQPKSKRRRIIL